MTVDRLTTLNEATSKKRLCLFSKCQLEYHLVWKFCPSASVYNTLGNKIQLALTTGTVNDSSSPYPSLKSPIYDAVVLSLTRVNLLFRCNLKRLYDLRWLRKLLTKANCSAEGFFMIGFWIVCNYLFKVLAITAEWNPIFDPMSMPTSNHHDYPQMPHTIWIIEAQINQVNYMNQPFPAAPRKDKVAKTKVKLMSLVTSVSSLKYLNQEFSRFLYSSVFGQWRMMYLKFFTASTIHVML